MDKRTRIGIGGCEAVATETSQAVTVDQGRRERGCVAA